jgi:hypothetical protein
VLFARRGLRLGEFCIENKIPYIAFDSFADIQREVESIMKEDVERTGDLGTLVQFNPRANLWRRVSSRHAVPGYVALTPSREEKMILRPGEFSKYKPKAVAESVAA